MSASERILGQRQSGESLDNGSDSTDARSRKVRTGCSMCKARKVKCDEEKPFCRKCTVGRRQCPGYSPPPPMKQRIRRSKYDVNTDEPSRPHPTNIANAESATSAVSPESFSPTLLLPAISKPLDSIDDFNEGRGIQFCQVHASVDLSAYFEGEFWQFSLQASHSEPIIRHALLAVSALHEAQEFSQSKADHARRLAKFALQQYTKAINNLLSRTTGDTAPTPQVVLVSCLIFIWFEFLQDNLDTALGHLRSGIRILSDQPRMSQCRNPDGFLFHLFTRLHTQAALHGSPTSTFDSNESFRSAGELLGSTLRFSGIREARSSLDKKLNEVFRFHRMIEQPGFVPRLLKERPFPHEQSLEAMCQPYLDGLKAWKVAYDEMQQRLRHPTTEGDSLCLYELELQYMLTTNTLTTLFATTPMVYDAYTAEFARIVYLSKQIIWRRRPQRRLLDLPFDTGVLAPLYYVLLKCRDLNIRRSALELLHECPEREGMWDRAAIIEFAEWKISKEEGSRALLGVSEKDILPEQARIYCEKPRAAVIDGLPVTIVSYKRGAYGGIADIEPDEEEITALSMRMAAVLGT